MTDKQITVIDVYGDDSTALNEAVNLWERIIVEELQKKAISRAN